MKDVIQLRNRYNLSMERGCTGFFVFRFFKSRYTTFFLQPFQGLVAVPILLWGFTDFFDKNIDEASA